MNKIINIPAHLVIIPDGNRRWAKKKKLAPWAGHEEGAKNFKVILKTARKLGIKHVTFWGSSLDNLTKRPLLEKKVLLEIYFKYFQEMLASREITENKIRVRVLGRWREQFPAPLVRIIDNCLEKTKKYNRFNLTLLLAYNGDDEMLFAIKNILRKYANSGKFNARMLKDNLMSRELPPVDLMLRTGGEPHLSNGLLMWDTRNAQLYFTKTFWPDFSPAEFRKAIRQFGKTERRLGK
ncbi:MAG: polyprenyl diphosphate synthase [Candidatus Moraniibacteriota bacterium]